MIKKVRFLDLRVTDKRTRAEFMAVINKIFIHGRIVLGPEVDEFERTMARYFNRKYAVGVNSGTDALFFGLKSLGIKKGDEVITTSLSWVATANAIALTGATPVFADIRDDLNIDPASLQRLITAKTKVILPVHYTGRVCPMDKIMNIAKKNNLSVVEDTAQSFGAKLNGQLAGTFGKIACFSMNPMKVYAACGEAGLILTDNEELYNRLIALRYNGTVNKEVCLEPSLNGRLDTIQAALLMVKLNQVDFIIRKRRQVAGWYNEKLKNIVQVPQESKNEFNVYYTYTILADHRDELKQYLEEKGIESKIQHPYLMPEQPAYKNGVKGEFTQAKQLVKQILCLPANEKITYSEVEYVCRCIQNFYKK